MTILEAIVIGAIQGITEFLPVSSSGHLVLAHELIGTPAGAASLDALLHMASLIVIMLLFRAELFTVARSILPSTPSEQRREGRELALYMVLGTLPLVVVGLAVRSSVTEALHTSFVTGVMLIVTAALLWIAERKTSKVGDAAKSLTLLIALGIGVAQTFAILPGLSRSGVTIAAGMLLGLSRAESARFSFLLSIPALAGAGILGAKELMGAGELVALPPVAVLISFVVAALTTWAAVVLFLKFVRRGSLTPFALYAISLGIVVLSLT